MSHSQSPHTMEKSDKLKKVYLSGRMKDVARCVYMKRFADAERQMVSYGCDVVNPTKFIFCKWPWLYAIMGYELCLLIDLWYLHKCDAIAMIGNDWMNSRGASTERAYAKYAGKEIIYLSQIAAQYGEEDE